MHSGPVNHAQRVVLVVALGAVLVVVGWWATSLSPNTGWTGYAPLTSGPLVTRGLHLWVRAVIWLILIGTWTITSLALLRSPGAPGTDAAPTRHE